MDIAIVGFAFELPQGIKDEGGLWGVLKTAQNLKTPWPQSRSNVDSFLSRDSVRINVLRSESAHFLNRDPGLFDAPFFSIFAKEAAGMDPQQKWVLETSYKAFENAGMPIEKLKGSQTAVFSATFSDDYTRMVAKDPATAPQTTITGTSFSLIANRVSWYFDLQGPSIQVDTACSGSLVALDLACQSLRTGNASMALVTGSNCILTPERSVHLTNLGLLSPDGVCYSFDSRANGYSRGEGVIAMVLKPVLQALRDGDAIRAVIRASSTNQDGKTPTLTQPSSRAQEALIRNVYKKAGLPFATTRYFEAHGTGTPVGDPIEMNAIGRVFGTHRSSSEPLYVGSVKANMGHLEGCSGLAGVLKCIQVLERGVIPPNALFETINPAIDLDAHNARIPTNNIPWPAQGLRRVSVNSFGFGGTNAHVVMDDTYHYLESHDLSGLTASARLTQHHPKPEKGDKLFVWSGSDVKALRRVVQSYKNYLKQCPVDNEQWLSDLAFTLAARRSRLPWRSFSVADENHITSASITDPVRSSSSVSLCFVFTGQGAQYLGMGMELIRYPIFRETMQRIDSIFKDLGCTWSVLDTMANAGTINKPDYSQPLCTALQISQVELLKSFGITPEFVVGHSSGEIAAAYAAGAVSLESACKLSYYRGQVTVSLQQAVSSSPGAMVSVNIPATEIKNYMMQSGLETLTNDITVACINSPFNSTLSGPEVSIDRLKAQLDMDSIFAQKLKTGVAYHSSAMECIMSDYARLINRIQPGTPTNVRIISSLTGALIPAEKMQVSDYWTGNLVEPVQFLQAIRQVAAESAVHRTYDFVEVGPHPVLRRFIQDILNHEKEESKSFKYLCLLDRSKPALEATLDLAGQLFCRGHSVSIAAVNLASGSQALLGNCPSYPFDHSIESYEESRYSRDYRLRKAVPSILGVRVTDWNPLEPRWRSFLISETSAWTLDHVVAGVTVFPGMGLLLMAIEAGKQATLPDRPISGFRIGHVRFTKPLIVSKLSEEPTEVMVHLKPSPGMAQNNSSWSDISVFTYYENHWTECLVARIGAQYHMLTEEELNEEANPYTYMLKNYYTMRGLCSLNVERTSFYKYSSDHGIQYGETFQLLNDIAWDGQENATASLNMSEKLRDQTMSLVHPAVLDAAVQLFMVQSSSGTTKPAPVSIPYELVGGFISASGWDSANSLRFMTKSRASMNNQGSQGSIYGIDDHDVVLCHFEKVVLRQVASSSDTNEVGDKPLHTISWRPQLSLLSPVQLHSFCHSGVSRKDEIAVASYRMSLESTLGLVIRNTRQELSEEDIRKVPESLKKYLLWMDHVLENFSVKQTDENVDRDAIAENLERLQESNPSWEIFPAVARNLKSILVGELDPLQLAFNSGLAENFYNDAYNAFSDGRLQALLELMTHETPGLRIIEVGAGTGALTKRILSIFQGIERTTKITTFTEYVYTDISGAFLERAKERFQRDYGDRMQFKILDIERNPEVQALELASFDLVVAGSVLHATSSLVATLRNVRALLKPQGHLVNLEIIAPEKIITNFVFGLLPGWWLGTEDWRPWCPGVNESQWEGLLLESGFSGNDLVLKDYHSDQCHAFRIMLSTATIDGPLVELPVQAPHIHIITNPRDATSLAQELKASLQSQHSQVTISSLDQVPSLVLEETNIVVCLVECHGFILDSPSETEFDLLKMMTREAHHLLWVTSCNKSNAETPKSGMAQGFLRSLRSEAVDRRFIILTIEKGDGIEHFLGQIYLDMIKKVMRASWLLGSKEVEYIARGEEILTGRLVEEPKLTQEIHSLTHEETITGPWLPGPPLQLTIDSPGFLETLCLVEDPGMDSPLLPQQVELEAKAWGLNFRDVFAALGRLEEFTLGSDCSGVVKRVGEGDSMGFEPGDRVCVCCPGNMRTYPRVPIEALVRIPDSLSFEEAASVMTPGMTAYLALIHIARLRKADTILIHSGAGGTGQMAIQIANMVGARVFTTVSTLDKKSFLTDNFDIPEDHIFSSRGTSFASAIKHMTHGVGVDVIVNSLSGDALLASWDCIAPSGRFVEIGKTDILSNSHLPMSRFSRNVSFSAIHLYDIIKTDPTRSGRLVGNVFSLIAQGAIRFPTPLRIFPVSEAEKAFRLLQSGKSMGKIILHASHDTIVQKRCVKRSSWSFNPTASYLVAGGLGGLGRAILRWMASKGAKYLIVPTRTGATSAARLDLIQELSSKGVVIVTPTCDVAEATSISKHLDDVRADMPPIAGLINASMVLQDAIFHNMTLKQWQSTIRSKASTSWNLHQLLPRGLDFFIQLSSLAGALGTPGQSNYAAGCAFQDALAHYRTTELGEKSVAIDIGWMHNIGIISENEVYRRNRERAADMRKIEDTELLALLDILCDPNQPLLQSSLSQILLGVMTPAQFTARGQPSINPILHKPLFSGFSHWIGESQKSNVMANATQDPSQLFKAASGIQARAEVVVKALADKLAHTLSILPTDVDLENPLPEFGIDSLMAIELRNWISKAFSANIAVFEVMGAPSIRSVGSLVAEKSKILIG